MSTFENYYETFGLKIRPNNEEKIVVEPWGGGNVAVDWLPMPGTPAMKLPHARSSLGFVCSPES